MIVRLVGLRGVPAQPGGEYGDIVLGVPGVEAGERRVDDVLDPAGGREADAGQPVQGLLDVLAAVLDQPVGEQQRGLAGVQPPGARLVAAEARSQGRADRHRQRCGAALGVDHGRGPMAGAGKGHLATAGVDAGDQTGDRPALRFRGGDVVELAQHAVRREIGGGDVAQRGPVRGHVHGCFQAVPHDVADDEQRPAEVQPDGLAPVAAHQGALPDGQIADGHVEVRVRTAGLGEQRPLELADDASDPVVLPGVPDVGGGAFGEEGEQPGLRRGERRSVPGADQHAVGVAARGQGDADRRPRAVGHRVGGSRLRPSRPPPGPPTRPTAPGAASPGRRGRPRTPVRPRRRPVAPPPCRPPARRPPWSAPRRWRPRPAWCRSGPVPYAPRSAGAKRRGPARVCHGTRRAVPSPVCETSGTSAPH